jgi:hypothetical protein
MEHFEVPCEYQDSLFYARFEFDTSETNPGFHIDTIISPVLTLTTRPHKSYFSGGKMCDTHLCGGRAYTSQILYQLLRSPGVSIRLAEGRNPREFTFTVDVSDTLLRMTVEDVEVISARMFPMTEDQRAELYYRNLKLASKEADATNRVLSPRHQQRATELE